MKTTHQDPLDDLVTKLLKKGLVRPDQVTVWTFKDLYLADPTTLKPDLRRRQIEFRNAKQFARLRIENGLSDN